MNFLMAVLLLSVTAGWENVSPERRPFPPAEVLWSADLSRAADFTWELREGASGKVAVTPQGIRIEKTNDAGYIVVKAAPFAVRKGRTIRCYADQESADADVNYSSGVVRGYGREENLAIDFALEHRNFWDGGVQTMRGFPCTPPGQPYRKYGDFTAKDDVFTPVILVSGLRSTSVWTNWGAEDLAAADKAWARTKDYAYVPRSTNRMDAAAFRRFIAADTVHTAEVRRIDGVSRIVADGEIVASASFHSYHVNPERKEAASFVGGALDGSAVRLMVKPVVPCRACDPDGGNTDFALLVDEIEDAMRAAPNSLFILGISCDAPRDFIQKHHPEEGWTRRDGEPLYGVYGSCIIGYLGSKKEDFRKFAFVWPSYSSRAWREWVKRQIRGILSEARARGLDKRIVGIHPHGYHDGQFSVPYTDYSKPAREEYARMLAEPGCLSTNYAFCVKQTGLRAQEEFAREFKRVLGKPAIAVRWCESPFMTWRTMSLDLTSFCRSDALDVVVCQPDYRERLPAFSTVQLLPLDSLHLHGKVFWNEIDYRTYAPQECLERGYNGPASSMSIGKAADIEMWRTMYRKVAGEADATRMGYWLYDILGGAFDTPEITADIRELAAESMQLARRKPSSWKPDVAFVLDEEQILPEVTDADPLDCMTGAEDFIYSYCCRLWGTSGVPHQRFFAADVLEDSSLLDGRKLVVFAFLRRIDERRAALLKRLAGQGTTLVYLSETGIRGGAEATGFAPRLGGAKLSVEVVPEPGVADNVLNLRDVYHQRNRNEHLAVPHRCFVEEGPDVKVLARYAADRLPAIAERRDADCRRVYVAAAGALTSGLLNRLARESGAYVAVDGTGLQVDMNGDFMSVHCLRPGRYTLRLPFPAQVANLKSRQPEKVQGRSFDVNLTAGETCRFLLKPLCVQ